MTGVAVMGAARSACRLAVAACRLAVAAAGWTAVGAAQVPSQVVVRSPDRALAVPVAVLDSGPAVRGDEFAAALGGQWRPQGGATWALLVEGTRLEFEAGSAWVRTAGQPVPLPSAPELRAGVLWLPFAVVTDVVPRVVSGVLYDASRAEVRLFRSSGTLPSAAYRASTSRGLRRTPPPGPPTIGEAPAPRASGEFTVVVDAGHGGPDRGMRGPHDCRPGTCVYEADITLEVAREVAAALRRRGARVVMTRTRDTLIALADRGHIANRARGDLFLSIHVNAANPRWSDPGATRGFETYFLSDAKTEDERRVAQMENESVRFETAADAPAGDDLSFLLNDMAQNEHLRESSEVARLVQDRLRRIHPGPNRGVKQAGFRVLVTAFMPAVLVEIGFGTNRREAAWMTDRGEQERLGAAVADAAMEYLARYERRVGGGRGPGGGR
ncbi:MAG: N-acetylmuramoyl-L-alanine amidase [Gemmatimonadetes bacterium]|jgi:N-acetylmuramoyl-L-alanine amidase|nr:N-acetylmuramoyl-L-alanine amidase [Gemmatimonadota bacterium]